MAISALYRSKEQSATKTSATSTDASENWVLQTDVAAIPVEVNAFMKALDDKNIYGFLVVGQVHPADESLVVTGFTISRAIDDTYTKYIVTTTLTNNNSIINNRVTPSRAQDSWQFSNAEVEVQVVQTKGSSKGEGLSSGNNEAIQNTNGTGILVFETASITRVVIVRNESDYNLRTASSHVGKTNSSSCRINGSTFPSGSCKLIKWAGSNAYDSNGLLYWRVTYEILVTDSPAFFEREFIMKGVVDKAGNSAPEGYNSSTEYKLDGDGFFLSKDDQADPTKFVSKSFVTVESSNWSAAVRLGGRPDSSITTLTGDSGFGLV